MKETLRRISAVYYAMYSGTIVLAVLAYFLNFNNIVVPIPQAPIVLTIEIAYYLLMSFLLIYSFYRFYSNNKKCLAITDLHDKFESYINAAIFRLYVAGILLILGVILFYMLRSMDLLYGIAVNALALIFSKPTENKIINELKLEDEE